MVWIIIAVLGIIIIVGLGLWLFQIRNNRAIQALDTRISTLDSGEVTGLIRNIAQLGLTGTSETAFKAQQTAYQKLAEGELTDLQTALLDVEQANKQFRFSTVKEDLATIDNLREATAKRLHGIRQALLAIQESEADNRRLLMNLRERYLAARKTILAKSFAYGDALPALESALQAIAAQLSEINQTNSDGDHDLAKKQLSKLKLSVATVELQVKSLPPLVNAVVNEFPNQLGEIARGYEQLAQRHFHFTEDVPATGQEIQEQVNQGLAQIESLDVTELTANTATIANRIDALYAVMEKELTAKDAVDQAQGDLRQFINHANKQNHALLIELDHVNQSYTLNHDELKQANALKQQLDNLAAAFEQESLRLNDHEAIYSETSATFVKMRSDLKDIELKQQAINTSIGGFRATEEKAAKQVAQFVMDLRDVKYEVFRHGLPGLPKPYLDFFNACSKAVADLNHDLNQVKIDLDAIAKQLIQSAEDIEQLKQKSRDLIQAAGMTEELLQYANRYKTTHSDVAQAVADTKAAYARYDYKQAADTIATALEAMEPGSYKKVEDDYLAAQDSALF
ncbi:septation ring formation regulator EzrA [Lacticaseibacillus kribbianus]|uniref:septation ring formation regulator EzrA n=1 Tax=Lacticaseibacillus kribbianus TaxID=2926292 RepID=UPI001CD6871E|nr:septation ring formation regulator EzrA [Lacticaseibacillus kribbianus]